MTIPIHLCSRPVETPRLIVDERSSYGGWCRECTTYEAREKSLDDKGVSTISAGQSLSTLLHVAVDIYVVDAAEGVCTARQVFEADTALQLSSMEQSVHSDKPLEQFGTFSSS